MPVVDVQAWPDAGGLTDLHLGDDDAQPAAEAGDKRNPVTTRSRLQAVEKYGLQSRRAQADGYLHPSLTEALPDEWGIVPNRGDADVFARGS